MRYTVCTSVTTAQFIAVRVKKSQTKVFTLKLYFTINKWKYFWHLMYTHVFMLVKLVLWFSDCRYYQYCNINTADTIVITHVMHTHDLCILERGYFPSNSLCSTNRKYTYCSIKAHSAYLSAFYCYQHFKSSPWLIMEVFIVNMSLEKLILQGCKLIKASKATRSGNQTLNFLYSLYSMFIVNSVEHFRSPSVMVSQQPQNHYINFKV